MKSVSGVTSYCFLNKKRRIGKNMNRQSQEGPRNPILPFCYRSSCSESITQDHRSKAAAVRDAVKTQEERLLYLPFFAHRSFSVAIYWNRTEHWVSYGDACMKLLRFRSFDEQL